MSSVCASSAPARDADGAHELVVDVDFLVRRLAVAALEQLVVEQHLVDRHRQLVGGATGHADGVDFLAALADLVDQIALIRKVDPVGDVYKTDNCRWFCSDLRGIKEFDPSAMEH